ncbi:hypothetical protein Tco_1485976, partial [Tanacetum coccineum]
VEEGKGYRDDDGYYKGGHGGYDDDGGYGGYEGCYRVMKVAIKDITVAVEEITAGMVAVVNDATPTEDAGAAVVLQKQMHTNNY